MSTGADAKTMPISPEYAEGYSRTFGDHPPQRGVFVMRCTACDGITHAEGVKKYMCPRCKAWEYGSVDASVAPPLMEKHEARNAGVLSGRFYENTSITIGDEKGRPVNVDVGSRARYEAFCKERGVTPTSDFAESWKPENMERRQRAEELADTKDRREAIAREVYKMEKQGRWR